MTGSKPSWPNLTADNIWSSVKPLASDSTISTASFVPATISSNEDSWRSSFVGFNTNSLFIYPTFEAATGPIKGKPEMLSAAELAISDKTSGSFSLSYEITVASTCVSFLNAWGNNGLIGLSINLDINVSASVGLASRLK